MSSVNRYRESVSKLVVRETSPTESEGNEEKTFLTDRGRQNRNRYTYQMLRHLSKYCLHKKTGAQETIYMRNESALHAASRNATNWRGENRQLDKATAMLAFHDLLFVNHKGKKLVRCIMNSGARGIFHTALRTFIVRNGERRWQNCK